MSIDRLIDYAKGNGIYRTIGCYEQRVMTRDMIFMLNEFKQQKKLKLIDQSLRKDLYLLIYIVHDPRSSFGLSIWRYNAYFRLKTIYLDMKEGKYENKKLS